jgi:peptide/nickel transport system substrate-binding protein
MRRSWWACVALIALAASACSGGGAGAPSGGGAAGGGTVVIDTSFDLKTADPGREYEFTGNLLTKAMYETLVTFDGGDVTKPLPGLADFTLSPDATTLTLNVKPGRVFSDGSPVTADDVVFSLQRVQGVKGNPSFLLDGVTIAKTGPSTVTLTSAKPNPALPYILPSPALSILNSKVVKANGGATDASDGAEKFLNGASAGSGPYMLSSLDVSSQAKLVRNPAYNGPDKPAYATAIVRNVAAPTQKLNVQRGDSQVALDLSSDQAKGLDSKLDVTSGASAYVIFLTLSQDPGVSAATSNPDFVAAVKKAVDYKGLLEVAGTGSVQPPGVIPSLFAGALPAEKAMASDLEGAKAALAKSGQAGQTVKLSYPSDFTVSGLSFQTLAERLQSQLAAAGITVTLAPAPVAAELEAYRNGKEQMGLWYWGPDYPYAADYLAFAPDGLLGKRLRWTAAQSPAIADVAGKAAVESAEATRTQLYQQFQEQLNATGPFVPLVQPPTNIVSAKSVSGIAYNPVWGLDVAGLGVR